MNEKYKELIGNSLLFMFSYICAKGIMFFLVPLYTAHLSAEELGVAELVVTSSNLLLPIVTLGISNAVFRYAMDETNRKSEVLTIYVIVLFISIPVCFAITRFSYLIPSLEKHSVYLFLLILSSGIYDSLSLYVKANSETKLFAFAGIVYVLILLTTTVLLVIHYKLGSYGYVLSIVISKVFSILFLRLLSKSSFRIDTRHVNKQLAAEMLSYSIPLVLNSIFWWVVSSSDKYMISYMMDNSYVGLYAIAAKIPSLVSTVVNVFLESYVISAIKRYEEGDDEFFVSTCRFFVGFMSIFVGVVLLIIKDFMHIYVNEAYYASIQYLPSLLIGAYFLGYGFLFGVVFNAAKQSKYIAYSSLISASINIGLNLLLIPRIGVLGAAIATMISYGIIAVYRYYFANKYIRFKLELVPTIISVFIILFEGVSVTYNFYPRMIGLISVAVLMILHFEVLKKSLYFVKMLIMRMRKKRLK